MRLEFWLPRENEDDTLELHIEGNLQLTYDSLRRVDTGQEIASLVNGDWYIEKEYGTIFKIPADKLGPWSDVLIYVK